MEELGGQFIEEMHELSEKGGDQRIQQFGQNLEATEKRIVEIDTMIMKLFEQNALGKISDERFEKCHHLMRMSRGSLTRSGMI